MSRPASFALSMLVAVPCLLTGCGTEPPAVPTAAATAALDGDGQLVLERLDDKQLAGTYETKLGLVSLTAYVESDTRLSAVAVVNDTQIDVYATSDDGGHIGFQVHGGKLDDAQHELLAGVHAELANMFPYPEEGAKFDDTPPHVQLLRSYLGFFSEAPALMRDDNYDTRIEREPRQPAPETPPKVPPPPPPPPPCGDVADNDGVTLLPACCGGGTTVAFQHDDLPGGHCFVTLAGSCGTSSPAGCAGRCGPGCTAFPGYYQDCLDHDLCLVHDSGGGGITPAGKCGDEWWEAADDFAVAYSWWAPMFWWVRTGVGGPCS